MNELANDRIYYAQNREDIILESFFLGEPSGFYVDVGACHPDVASVTKRFYLKGWRGINIEPQKNLHGLFEKDRPRDTNLNIGISDKETTIILRSYIYNQGLSTVTKNIKDDHAKSNGNKTEQYEDISLKVKPLSKVLEEQAVGSIQFLKVDVEGHEYEVLHGNDWTRYRPEVICIEANHIIKNWKPLLKRNDYTLVFFDGLNEYYADARTNRAKKFDYVQHVVVNLRGGISAEDYDTVSSLADTRGSAQKNIGQSYGLGKKLRERLSLIKNKSKNAG